MSESLSNPEYFLEKARVRKSRQDSNGLFLRECIDIISTGIVAFPKSPELYLQLGDYLNTLNSLYEEPRNPQTIKNAILAFQAANALDCSKGWYNLSKLLEETQQHEEALAVCRRYLEYLEKLRPGKDYVANPNASFFQKLSLVKSFEQHRAEMNRAQLVKRALRECRFAISSWNLAYKILEK